MQIKFSKMHSAGNDFVVIDGRNQQLVLTSKQVAALADRHYGIGCDQLLLLEKSPDPKADYHYRIFNGDGQEVEQCGNGARCLMAFIAHHQIDDRKSICVSTQNRYLQLIKQADDIEVNLGVPEFDPEKIPLKLKADGFQYMTNMGDQKIVFFALSLGNPHAVIEVQDIESESLKEIAAFMQSQPFFPASVNVGFMKIENKQTIRLRVWERGVGETLACGSGAAAAAIAGIRTGKLEKTVMVRSPGGKNQVCWRDPHDVVYLRGTPVHVFDGVVSLDAVSGDDRS